MYIGFCWAVDYNISMYLYIVFEQVWMLLMLRRGMRGHLECDLPNARLYEFTGALTLKQGCPYGMIL